MDYTGLMVKYKYRSEPKLVADELNKRLHPGVPVDLNGEGMVDELSVIRMNSDYMEVVDKYYHSKGFLAFPALSLLILLMWATYSLLKIIFNDLISPSPSDIDVYLFCIPASIITALFSLLCYFMLKKEAFAWTHYPIRFDRKNQLVHVFNLEGNVFSAPWRDIVFTTGCSVETQEKRKDFDIRGHLLDDDGTVLETFSLPMSSYNHDDLYRHWEFIRRYMDEGPDAVAHVITLCPPVENRREGLFFGYWYLFMNFYGAPLLLWPLFMALSVTAWLPRLFAMYTSRLPRWTPEVDALCTPDPHDRWNISAARNPRSVGLWVINRKNKKFINL